MRRAFVILLHIGYWLMYLLLVFLFLLIASNRQHVPMLQLVRTLFLSPLTIIAVLPAVVSFYIFYSILFPRFLQTKRLLKLLLSGICTVVLSGAVAMVWMLALVAGKTHNPGISDILGMLAFLSVLAAINGIIAMVMRGFISWYADIRIKKELENKNLETELALVKSQINPHFLFNTIHNIDILIGVDAARASSYLNQLSDMLRFTLYEAGTDEVALARELSYIRQYVELQKIRTANAKYVEFEVSGDVDAVMVRPMILISLVENAFKHSAGISDGCVIRIRVVLIEQELIFYCENRYRYNENSNHQEGGLGNELLKKRLRLSYPGKHQLQIDADEAWYRVQLKLMLHADPLHHR